MNLEKITVFARLRPVNEKKSRRWIISQKSLSLEKGKEFKVDKVFPGETTNEEIYDQTKSSIDMVLRGANAAILAYGQTGSGKTFTILGLLSNAFREIVRKVSEETSREYSIKVSYIEVYNEIVNDLLSSFNNEGGNVEKRPKLKIRDHPVRGVVINGVTEILVKEYGDFMKLLNFGEKKRHYGRTKMNDNSSRSHTIYIIQVESKLRNIVFEDSPSLDSQESGNGDDTMIDEGEIEDQVNRKFVSSLSFVDLAGSEKQKRSNTSGLRFTEGCYINKSLLALGVVISKLSENSMNTTGRNFVSQHIPYRDSKLTRILKPALGNNSLCSIICCIDPRESSIEESISTLKFACRASKVKSKVKVNEVFDFETNREKKYFRKIQKLQNIIKRKNEIIRKYQEQKHPPHRRKEERNIEPPPPERKRSLVLPNFHEVEEEEEEDEIATNNRIRYDQEIEKFQEILEERSKVEVEKKELEKKVSLLEGEKIFLEVQNNMLEEEKEKYRAQYEEERTKRQDLESRISSSQHHQTQTFQQQQQERENSVNTQEDARRGGDVNIIEEGEEEGTTSGVKRKRDVRDENFSFEHEYKKYTVTKKRKIT